jgi:MYXO-CTERM domain-containing protein
MGTTDLDGGTMMVDAGPGIDGGPGSDGGGMGRDGGGVPTVGRSPRRGGCAVSAGAESTEGDLLALSLLGLAAMVLTRRRKR